MSFVGFIKAARSADWERLCLVWLTTLRFALSAATGVDVGRDQVSCLAASEGVGCCKGPT